MSGYMRQIVVTSTIAAIIVLGVGLGVYYVQPSLGGASSLSSLKTSTFRSNSSIVTLSSAFSTSIGTGTAVSSSACQESIETAKASNLTLNINEDTPVVFTIYGRCNGLSLTNLTVASNSNLNMTFPQNILTNATEFGLDYISSGFPARTSGPNCPAGAQEPNPCFQIKFPNVTADKDTSMNYTLLFGPPLGYVQQIQPDQFLSFTVMIDSQFKGNYVIELRAASSLQEVYNVTVT